jgi:photosystem II stability/assembly factor-like uncharacterized protein
VNPQPSGFHNRKIVFTDQQTGFILNYNGDLIKTTDQGENWNIVHTFYQSNAFDAKDSIIVIGGSSGVLVSSDLGVTWQKSPFAFQSGFIDIDIVSRDTIFMIGLYSFYKSVDRGISWQVTNLGNSYLSCIDFIDSKIGFIGRTNTSMLKTLDGGLTWQQMLNQNTSSAYFYSVKFLNRDTAYAWKEYDSLYKTTDRGLTWTRYSIGRKIMGMSFPSATDGYLVGEYGVVYTTRNAGTTWSPGTSPERGFNRTLYSVYFITPAIGFTVGLHGQISKTVDGGVTWKRNALDLNDIMALSFPNSNVGYVGTRGHAFKTTDKGKTWNMLNGMDKNNSYNSAFEHAHFFSPDSGFFTASYPARLFKTNNGGTSWRTIRFFANQYGTEFEQNPTVQAVGDSTLFMLLYDGVWGHRLYKSKDEGESWNQIDSTKPGGIKLSSVFFLNEKTGYATRGYQLYKTIDSAKSWSILRNHNNSITKMYFLNEAEGFIADNEYIRRTADSGKTWTALEVEGSVYEATPTSFLFKDDSLGFYTTSSGRIMKTLDRGKTWRRFDKIASDANRLVKGGDDKFYAAGLNGVIVRLPADTSWGTVSACHGSDFTFIADSGTSVFSYQWQVNKDTVFTNITDNGIYSGSESFKLTIHNVPASWTNYQYRCKVRYDYSRVFTFRFNATWTGAVDNNWENPANWSCGVVPDINTDVTITAGSVTINQSTTIRSLQINPAVSINVGAGVILNIRY